MVSDEQIREALRQAQEQWAKWTGKPAPPLPVWVYGMFARDTHDEWRRLNEEG